MCWPKDANNSPRVLSEIQDLKKKKKKKVKMNFSVCEKS